MQAATAIEQATKYGITRKVKLTYDQAIAKITETLKEQGFGILTQIDVKTTLKAKIDKDIPPYIIMGACNPNLAYQALTSETNIGLLLPCNVVVYTDPADSKTVVGILDPSTMVELTGKPEMGSVAKEARKRLEAALSAIE